MKFQCFHICAGKLCIEVTPSSRIAYISEELCIGCGICIKVGFHLFVDFNDLSKWIVDDSVCLL